MCDQMELLFVDFFSQVLWLGKKIGNKDEACSVNIACRAFSFGFFSNICFSEHLSDLKLSPETVLLWHVHTKVIFF